LPCPLTQTPLKEKEFVTTSEIFIDESLLDMSETKAKKSAARDLYPRIKPAGYKPA
jgi:hypothetical protein